jgi:uncharacterized protein (AIM24 family)
MPQPQLLPNKSGGESFAGYSYHLDGGLVPALTVELNGGTGVYFEHHTLLWKSTGVTVGVKALGGAFNRFISGMPVFMTEATGNGAISFSRDGVGQIFPLHLKRGVELDVREHQFLAATESVNYSFQMVRGVANILFGGTGFFIDKFVASDNDGIVWLYGYGNVFEVNLAAGEQIDVEPSAWLYKDPTVTLDTNLTNLSTGLFGGSSFTLNRFTGPGKLGIQSMSLSPIAAATQQADANATAQGAGALGLAAAAFKMFSKD